MSRKVVSREPGAVHQGFVLSVRLVLSCVI